MFLIVFLIGLVGALFITLMGLLGVKHRTPPLTSPHSQLRGTYRPDDVIDVSQQWKQASRQRSLETSSYYGWQQVQLQGHIWTTLRHGGDLNCEGQVEWTQPQGNTQLIHSPQPQKGGMFGYALCPHQKHILISQPFGARGGLIYACDLQGNLKVIAQGDLGYGVQLRLWRKDLLRVTYLKAGKPQQQVLQWQDNSWQRVETEDRSEVKPVFM